MKNLNSTFKLCLFVIWISGLTFAGTITTAGNGDWGSTTPNAPWPGGVLPGSNDDVIIRDGDSLAINDANSYTINSLTIGQGVSGKLCYGAGATAASSLTINGDLILATGAQYILGSLPSSVEVNLYVNGNLNVGNGAKFDHGSGSSKGVKTNFTKSAGDQTVTSTGTPVIIQFNKIIVNRPSTADRVLCTTTIYTKGGNFALTLTSGIWEQNAGTFIDTTATTANMNLGTANGTLKVTGTGNFWCTSSIVGANGSNGSDAALYFNTTGTITTGAKNSQARLQNSNTLEIIAGTVNIYGRFTISAAATISGGTINIDPQGPVGSPLGNTNHPFEVTSSGSLTMSNGVITVIDPIQATGTGLDVKFSTSAIYNITGGTIRLGDGVSTTTGADGFQVSTHTVPLWNLEINADNNVPGRAVTLTDGTAARNLVVKNNLTINSGTLFANFGTGSNITLGGAFSNSGTFTPAATATFTFNGSSSQITNILPANIGNLVLANTAGITITNPVNVSGMLTLGGNNSYTSLGNVNSYSGVTYAATVGQTTGTELPATITNLTINNSNGVTLGGNTTVNGTFTFTNGNMITGVNTITLGSSASLVGEAAGRYLIGNITTTHNVGTSLTNLSGIGVSIASGTDSLGNVTVLRVSGANGIVTANGNQGIARKWTITSEFPPTNGRDLTLKWVSSDDNGKTFSLSNKAIAYRYNGSTWNGIGIQDVSASDPRSITLSTTSFSPWTISDQNAPLSLKTLNLGALIEGFYDGSSMVSDTVTVELHNATTPWALVDQAKTVLSTTGAGTANFFLAADAANYYLAVKHRNAVETWSANPQQFTGGALSYDFTTASNKAYSDGVSTNLPMKQVGSKWCFWSGDVTHNYFIEYDDLLQVYNFYLLALEDPGYWVEDVSGNQFVEFDDVILVYNNYSSGIWSQNPLNPVLFTKPIKVSEVVN
jgi:hypothetical protein